MMDQSSVKKSTDEKNCYNSTSPWVIVVPTVENCDSQKQKEGNGEKDDENEEKRIQEEILQRMKQLEVIGVRKEEALKKKLHYYLISIVVIFLLITSILFVVEKKRWDEAENRMKWLEADAKWKEEEMEMQEWKIENRMKQLGEEGKKKEVEMEKWKDEVEKRIMKQLEEEVKRKDEKEKMTKKALEDGGGKGKEQELEVRAKNKNASDDVWTLEDRVLYRWKEWRLIWAGENSLYIWCNSVAIKLRHNSEGGFAFFMNGQLGWMYNYGRSPVYNSDNASNRAAFIDELRKAKKTVPSGEQMTKTVLSVPRESQTIQFGKWNLASIKTGILMISHQECPGQKLAIKEGWPGLMYEWNVYKQQFTVYTEDLEFQNI